MRDPTEKLDITLKAHFVLLYVCVELLQKNSANVLPQ